jgi:hypothetical protein
MKTPDKTTEKRLDEIREQAALGRLDARGIRPPGSPFPETTSYYGLPIVKAPVWTWEVPLYFFAGGAAGASSVVAFTAQLTGASRSLVRDARLIAAIGAAVSGPLLILDLGRPERFLNMLRIFKPQSPMSVGAWTLTVFGAASAGAVIAEMLSRNRPSFIEPPSLRGTRGEGGTERIGVRVRGVANAPSSAFGTLRLAALAQGRLFSPAKSAGAKDSRLRGSRRLEQVGDAAAFVAALSGLVMATYTGVLLGATAIPVWAKHSRSLPIHFGASALASATALLTLRGHDEAALNVLGIAAAAVEVYMGIEIESREDVESEPLRHGASGVTTRIGGFFSGPLPLALRLLGIRSKRARRAAAASALLGSVITRIAWIEAGKASARDPRPQLT